MAHEFILPIVGLWFKPPAMKIIKVLPLNTKLELVHEPQNPIDPNAVAVWLAIADLNLHDRTVLQADLKEAIDGGTWLEKSRADPKVTIQAETYDEFRQLAHFQLGYISAENAKLLVNRRDFNGHAHGKLKWGTPVGKKAAPASVWFQLGD